MNNYIIGIDTGGTCTDAVLINADSGAILATAKEATTHHHLAMGSGKALARLLADSGIDRSCVRQLALSTTLATNAVVEKKGARIGLFVVGYVKHFSLPVEALVFLKGGHTIQGREEQPLELDKLVDTLKGLQNEIDAYGVCASMAMENPAHELVIEKAISMLDPKPVFCSHRVSQQAGMHERAATAALHAKLMPLMQNHLDNMRQALTENGLDCPVTIIGGNGAPVPMDLAVTRAALTVASGPACTAWFGASQTDHTALIVDIGGTTTDIAMLEDGRPVLAREGCQIGDWQTQIEAVDMFTAGIGGDSIVKLDQEGQITVGPARVVPLAMARDLPDISGWLGPGNQGKCISLIAQPTADTRANPIVDFLHQNGPATAATIAKATQLSGVPLAKSLETLSRKQLIQESGFTPTDALHILGHLQMGNKEAAAQGAQVLANLCSCSVTEFCTRVIKKTEDQIENLLIDYVIHRQWGKSLAGFLSSRYDHPVLGVSFSLKIPLIGIGAAAQAFLPQVARRLGTTVSFPEHYQVGNAVGAALICNMNRAKTP